MFRKAPQVFGSADELSQKRSAHVLCNTVSRMSYSSVGRRRATWLFTLFSVMSLHCISSSSISCPTIKNIPAASYSISWTVPVETWTCLQFKIPHHSKPTFDVAMLRQSGNPILSVVEATSEDMEDTTRLISNQDKESAASTLSIHALRVNLRERRSRAEETKFSVAVFNSKPPLLKPPDGSATGRSESTSFVAADANVTVTIQFEQYECLPPLSLDVRNPRGCPQDPVAVQVDSIVPMTLVIRPGDWAFLTISIPCSTDFALSINEIAKADVSVTMHHGPVEPAIQRKAFAYDSDTLYAYLPLVAPRNPSSPDVVTISTDGYRPSAAGLWGIGFFNSEYLANNRTAILNVTVSAYLNETKCPEPGCSCSFPLIFPSPTPLVLSSPNPYTNQTIPPNVSNSDSSAPKGDIWILFAAAFAGILPICLLVLYRRRRLNVLHDSSFIPSLPTHLNMRTPYVRPEERRPPRSQAFPFVSQVFRYKPNSRHEVDAICSICLSDYESSDSVRALPCLHKFHAACIEQWLQGHSTCPLCKIDLATLPSSFPHDAPPSTTAAPDPTHTNPPYNGLRSHSDLDLAALPSFLHDPSPPTTTAPDPIHTTTIPPPYNGPRTHPDLNTSPFLLYEENPPQAPTTHTTPRAHSHTISFLRYDENHLNISLQAHSPTQSRPDLNDIPLRERGHNNMADDSPLSESNYSNRYSRTSGSNDDGSNSLRNGLNSLSNNSDFSPLSTTVLSSPPHPPPTQTSNISPVGSTSLDNNEENPHNLRRPSFSASVTGHRPLS